MLRSTLVAVTVIAILSSSAVAAAAAPETSPASGTAKAKPAAKTKRAKKKKAAEPPAAAPAPVEEPTPAPEPPKPVEPPPAPEPVSTTTTTAAELTPPPPPPVLADAPAVAPASRTDEHLRGLEIMVRPGFGSAASDSPIRFQPSPNVQTAGDPGALLKGAAPYSAGFVGQAFIGFRFHPIISGGLRGGLRTTSAGALPDGSTNLSRSSWDAGFYVRAYPLALNESIRKHIDPWVGVGIEYMRDTQSFQRRMPTSTGASVNADITLDHHAVAVPIGLGVDYRIHPMLSVGPSFEYAISNGLAGCVKQAAPGFSGSTLCTNESPGREVIKANQYGVWSASLDVKVTPF